MKATKIAFVENNRTVHGVFFQLPWYRCTKEYEWSVYCGYNPSFISWYRRAKRWIIPLLINYKAVKLHDEAPEECGDEDLQKTEKKDIETTKSIVKFLFVCASFLVGLSLMVLSVIGAYMEKGIISCLMLTNLSVVFLFIYLYMVCEKK